MAGNSITGFQEGITHDGHRRRARSSTTRSDNNSTWDIGLTQDDRYKPGLSYEPAAIQPSSSNPWLIQNETVQNNVFADSTGGMFQFYVLDKLDQPIGQLDEPRRRKATCSRTSDANSQPTMVGWGGSDNHDGDSTTRPRPTSRREPAPVGSMRRRQPTPRSAASGPFISSQAAVAVAMPGDVAAAVGVPSGTRHLGAF